MSPAGARTALRRVRDALRVPPELVLVAAVLLIALAGVLNIASASAALAWRRLPLGSHVAGLAAGLVVGVALARAGTARLERWAYALYALLVLGVVATFVASSGIRGVHRWVHVGRFALQPSECIKLGLVLALARFVADGVAGASGPRGDGRTVLGVALILSPALLVAAQPDLGTAVVLVLIASTMVLATGAGRRPWLVVLGVTGAPALVFLVLLRAYQRARVAAFLRPAAHRLTTGYQPMRAQIAVATGHWTGRSEARLPHAWLPEAHTDFAFAWWAHTRGFAGVALLLGLYAAAVAAALRIASGARTRFDAALALGTAVLLFVQAAVNGAMALGLLPVAGVPMPLLSLGGSSAGTTLVAVCLAVAVARRRHDGLELPPGLGLGVYRSWRSRRRAVL